jgi:hypothetical protein
MGKHEITLGFELNEKQEALIKSICDTVGEDYNYLFGDILGIISHSHIWYDFIKEDREEYESLREAIIKEIEYVNETGNSPW